MSKWSGRLALAGLLAGASLALPSFASELSPGGAAKDATPSMKDLTAPLTLQDAPPPSPKIYGTLGVTVTTDYISRGLLLENQGAIVQPTFELGFVLYEGSGFVSKVTAFGDVWSSLHSNHEFSADDDLAGWYEFDWWAGVSVDFGKYFNFKTIYYEFLSPADAFGTAKNLEFTLAFNDADMMGAFSLKPYAKAFIELDGKAGTGSDEGVYVELGATPSVPLGNNTGFALAFPLTVGLGFSDFYGDETGDDEVFGFASVGAVLSLPMNFIPREYGIWSANVGVYYYHFGDGTNWFNAGAGGGDEDDDEFVAALSIGFTFP